MNRSTPEPRAAAQRGVTLVELLTVVSVSAIVLAASAPSFETLRQTRALLGSAAQLETDLQLARSEAVARNQPVRVTLGSQGEASCLVVHTGGADDCHCEADGRATCNAGVQTLRSAGWTLAKQRVQLQSNVGGLWFEPVRGSATPTATIKLVAADGRALHQVVNLLGRVRTCSPDGALAGVRPC